MQYNLNQAEKHQIEHTIENFASISCIALNNASFKISKWKESSKFAWNECLNLRSHNKLEISAKMGIQKGP